MNRFRSWHDHKIYIQSPDGAVFVTIDGTAHPVGLNVFPRSALGGYSGDRGEWDELELFSIADTLLLRVVHVESNEGGDRWTVTDLVSRDSGRTWSKDSSANTGKRARGGKLIDRLVS